MQLVYLRNRNTAWLGNNEQVEKWFRINGKTWGWAGKVM